MREAVAEAAARAVKMYLYPQPVRRGSGFQGLGGSVRRQRPRRLRLRGLGQASALTADQAFQQAMSMYSGQHVNPRDYPGNSAWIASMVRQIGAAQFDPWPGCTGQAPSLNLFQTASGLALGTTAATVGILSHTTSLIPAAAVPVIGWVVAGVGAIISIIGAIFAHHAAAVKRDMNFSCSALPAVNNALALIQQGVQNGTMSPSDAAAALPQIYSQFMAAGGASGSITGPGGIPSGGAPINNHPYCNSNCEMSVVLLAMVLYWQSKFQAMAAQAAAGPLTSSVQSSVQAAAAAVGIPSWLIWALGGYLVYEAAAS